MTKQLLITASILFFIIVSTIVVILYGMGYRFGFTNGKPDISGTGLLVATSIPDGAQVHINGHLTTATNNTLNLFPGTYEVKIFKEGYFAWQKTIVVQKEVVSKADALLYPTAPKLESITPLGILHPSLDPSQSRIGYAIASQSARKNGVYILDMSSRPVLTLQSSSTQIVDDTVDTFSQSTLRWSPDGKQLLATVTSETRTPAIYLLDAAGFNPNPQDVTATVAQIESTWEKEKMEKEKARIDGLKKTLKDFIGQNFTILAWSPDETKLLYEASQSATLPLIITPPLLGTNSTPEDRTLKKGETYVYDIKEDKNFKMNVPQKDERKGNVSISWFPDSRHLIYVHDKRIDIVEYDGINATTVYAGPSHH